MPFVRYARDRRGYETLYVMHAFEAEGSGAPARSPRPRVLYACRTVPYAKVGRMTIDESVQRRIETAYPNLAFDWPRLLKEAAQSAPRPERPDARQERKGKGRRTKTAVPKVPEVRRVRQVQVQEVPKVPEVHQVPEPLEPVTELIEWSADEPGEPVEPMGEPTEPTEPIEPIEPIEVPVTIPPLTLDPSWPVVRVAGPDRALILRGRYIEIVSRVLSRVADEAGQRRLFRDARRLNPEAWTTEEQVREGLAAFEEVYARLSEQLRRQRPV